MAKIRKDLVGSVLVENPKGGDPLVLVAGDKVPDGIELGAHVLAPKKSGDDSTATGNGGESGAQSGADGASDSGDASNAPPALVVPPRGGAGSGADAWRAYAVEAARVGGLIIEIPAEAGRDEIIEALNGAGIATE